MEREGGKEISDKNMCFFCHLMLSHRIVHDIFKVKLIDEKLCVCVYIYKCVGTSKSVRFCNPLIFCLREMLLPHFYFLYSKTTTAQKIRWKKAHTKLEWRWNPFCYRTDCRSFFHSAQYFNRETRVFVSILMVFAWLQVEIQLPQFSFSSSIRPSIPLPHHSLSISFFFSVSTRLWFEWDGESVSKGKQKVTIKINQNTIFLFITQFSLIPSIAHTEIWVCGK